MNRFALLASLSATVLLIAGCPAPTGRTRGPLNNDGGACAVSQIPVSGERCSTNGASCDFDTECTSQRPGTFRQTSRCNCVDGLWTCRAAGPCFERLADGGVACPDPNSPTSFTFACGEELSGRTCSLPLFQCPNGARPPTSCTCDGNLWQCEPPECGGAVPDGGMNITSVGAPCSTDRQCAPWSCDTGTVAGGHCTGACRPSSQQSVEEVQCGLGASCVGSSESDGVCARTCRAGAVSSGCRPGMICSGAWPSQPDGQPDRAGCIAFCSTDGDCPSPGSCNRRTGRCNESPENLAGRADGQPCSLSDSSACRGTCFQVAADGDTGICGSLIDLERRRDCLDGMGVEPLAPTGDNLGICVFRRCDRSLCCPSGLVCEGDESTGFCTIDDPGTPNLSCDTDASSGASDASADASNG